MDLCGLSHADFWTYVAHLRSPSIGVQIRAELLAMDGTVLRQIKHIVGGQVDVDTTQKSDSAVRQATLVVSDPGHTMGWDSNNLSDSAAKVDRQIRIQHRTFVPALSRVVSCNLITGPVRGWSRNGSEVTLTIHGRDELMLGQAWRTRTYVKGRPKTAIVKDLLQYYGGNAAGRIPDLPSANPATISVASAMIPMRVAYRVAASLDRRLFFDGSGEPLLLPFPKTQVMTIWSGDQGVHRSDVIEETQIEFAMDSDWFNVVKVTGATDKIVAHAYPPPSSAIHPQNMSSGGAWTVRLREEANANLRSVADAQALANRLMEQQLHLQASITLTTKCFPFLQEGDLLHVAVADGGVTPLRLQRFSIDFTGAGMSLGWNKRFVSKRAARPSKARFRR